jgi:hypothetical protein
MTRAQQTLSILLLVSSVRGSFRLKMPNSTDPCANLALPRPIPGARTPERNCPK